MSARTSNVSPRNCSGDAYAGVPMIFPWAVTKVSVFARVETERPKSPTFTEPSGATKQLEGLMSRCSTPFAKADSRPAMTSRIASTASATGSGPRFLSLSLSVPPPAISIVITGRPSISSLPKM